MTAAKRQNKVLVISSLWPSTTSENSATQLVQQIANRSKLCQIAVLAPYGFFRAKKIWLPGYVPKPLLFQSLGYPALPMRGDFGLLIRFLINELLVALFLFPRVFRLIKSNQIELLHLHGESGLVFLSFLAKKFLKTRVILTNHGASLHSKKLAKHAVFRKIASAAYENVDRIVVVGDFVRQYYASLGVSELKILKIVNGHDSSTTLPDVTNKVRSDHQGKVIIVGVSRLVDWKGVDITLQALKSIANSEELPDWTYLHVGDGPELGKLLSMRENLSLTAQTTFMGHLAYDDTMSIMAAGDIFVLPSWGEAFGIVYLEAMSRGLPAIGCASAGGKESIVDGETGFLVPKNDNEELARKLTLLVSDKALRERLSNNAKAHSKLFTWQRNSEEYIRLYRDEIAEASG